MLHPLLRALLFELCMLTIMLSQAARHYSIGRMSLLCLIRASERNFRSEIFYRIVRSKDPRSINAIDHHQPTRLALPGFQRHWNFRYIRKVPATHLSDKCQISVERLMVFCNENPVSYLKSLQGVPGAFR